MPKYRYIDDEDEDEDATWRARRHPPTLNRMLTTLDTNTRAAVGTKPVRAPASAGPDPADPSDPINPLPLS